MLDDDGVRTAVCVFTTVGWKAATMRRPAPSTPVQAPIKARGGDKGREGAAGGQAITLRKLRERRARARKLAELLADEAGCSDGAMDRATGVAPVAHATAAIRAAVARGAFPAIATAPPAVHYALAAVTPSAYPPRRYCSECGIPAGMSCTRCGARYCSGACGATHKETRCLTAS